MKLKSSNVFDNESGSEEEDLEKCFMVETTMIGVGLALILILKMIRFSIDGTNIIS